MKLFMFVLLLMCGCECSAQGQASSTNPVCGLTADGSNKVPSDWDTFTAPAKGGSYTDATFGCQVTRLTDGSTDFGATQYAVANYYATVDAMSADDGLIQVQRDNGSNYIIQNPYVTGQNGTAVPSGSMPGMNSGYIMWDRSNGSLFYYTTGTSLMSGTVTGRPSCLTTFNCTVTTAVVHTFSEYAGGAVSLMSETTMSVDGCHVVVEGQTAVGSSPINVFTWNICDSTKSTPYTTSCNGNVTSAADSCLHKMQIAGDNNIFMLLETSNSEVLWNGTSTV